MLFTNYLFNKKGYINLNEALTNLSVDNFDDIDLTQNTQSGDYEDVDVISGKKECEKMKWVKDNFVDFDLPSKTLWCKYNIGANTPEECGNFYAWGEIEPKQNYSWDTYKYGHTEDDMVKYNEDGMITLNFEDDAAYQQNNIMTIPNIEQFQELIKYTYSLPVVVHGTAGRKFISRKDESKSIFIPAAGYKCDDADDIHGSGSCQMWTNEMEGMHRHHGTAIYFWFNSTDDPQLYAENKYLGFSVRGVTNLKRVFKS